VAASGSAACMPCRLARPKTVTTSMEIYILRDGAQIGPFSEETTHRLLTQGSVLPTDLAWQAGSPKWIPLQNVLAPGPATKTVAEPPAPPRPAPEPAPAKAPAPSPAPVAEQKPAAPAKTAADSAPAPAARKTSSEPASAKQKAFLSYIGATFQDDIGKEEAALLVNDAMEHPKDPARLARWTEDRLRLHPDLYAAELQARKENRSNRFFELAETEGEECFDGLTKAHCQVLVGYLDVKYPNWDAKEADATWNYFYPAIAEKFPDVVRKEWRSKLKYPSGPKVAAELKGPGPARMGTNRHRPSPVAAMFKGLSIGAIAVAVFAAGIYIARHPVTSTTPATGNPAPAPGTGNAVASAEKSARPEMTPAEKALTFPEAKTGEHRQKRRPETAITEPAPKASSPAIPATPAPAPAITAPNTVAEATPAATVPVETVPAVPPAPADPTMQAAPDSNSLFGAPTATTPAPAPAPAATAPADATPADGATAKAGNSSLDSLFGPPTTTPSGAAAPAPAPAPAVAPTTVAAPPTAPATPAQKEVVLTKPVEVPVAFGVAKLPIGTHLRFVTHEGTVVKVAYMNQVVSIPASSTDVVP